MPAVGQDSAGAQLFPLGGDFEFRLTSVTIMNYPDDRIPRREVAFGGMDKHHLLSALAAAGVELNEYARILFSSDNFTTLATRRSVLSVELAVRDLGLAQGATTMVLYARAAALGLGLAPLELAAHLRLQYLEQPEGFWGHPVVKHRAPPGSVTVATAVLSGDAGYPKGFYLRRIKGTLWLRGYCCDDASVWDADDRFVFCQW